MTWKPLSPQPGENYPSDLGASLDRLGKSLGVPSTHVLQTVFAKWEETVGEALAVHARPLSIRDGTLLIAVTDSTWATELRWLAPELLDKLAKAAGQAVASGVEVRVVRSTADFGAPSEERPSGRMGPSPGSVT